MISPRCKQTARRDGNRPGHGHEEVSPVTHPSYETTYRALNDRAAAYVAGLDESDPLARANALIDCAVALQDAGELAAADALLVQADELLELA